ncbi:MAG: hypothetical protein WBE48_05995 [Xanthobacteraceae bacterium]
MRSSRIAFETGPPHLVDDLLADLMASDYLGGKIVMPGLSDAELRQAYRSPFPSAD